MMLAPVAAGVIPINLFFAKSALNTLISDQLELRIDGPLHFQAHGAESRLTLFPGRDVALIEALFDRQTRDQLNVQLDVSGQRMTTQEFALQELHLSLSGYAMRGRLRAAQGNVSLSDLHINVENLRRVLRRISLTVFSVFDMLMMILLYLSLKVAEVSLSESGHLVPWWLTPHSDDDVLILIPALIDLQITAPDVKTAGRVDQYVTSAGSATLYLEMYDSVSGEILARLIDRRNMQNYGAARWANSVTNRADATRMFRRWASLLRQAMDEQRADASLPPIQSK